MCDTPSWLLGERGSEKGPGFGRGLSHSYPLGVRTIGLYVHRSGAVRSPVEKVLRELCDSVEENVPLSGRNAKLETAIGQARKTLLTLQEDRDGRTGDQQTGTRRG